MLFNGHGMQCITLFAVIGLFMISGSEGMKVQTSIAPEPGSHAEVLAPIGLAVGSQLDISYEFESNPSSGAVLLFLLYSRQQLTEYLDRVDNVNIPLSILCDSASITRESLHSSGVGNMSLSIRSTDQYTAYIASCSISAPVVIHLEANYVNPDSIGKLSQHLPLEDVPFIQLLGFLSLCYLLLLLAWIHSCVQNWPFASSAHVLVTLVLITRALSSLTSSIRCGPYAIIKMLLVQYIQALHACLYRYALQNASGEEFLGLKVTGDVLNSFADAFFIGIIFLKSLGSQPRRSKIGGAYLFLLGGLMVVVGLHADCQLKNFGDECATFVVIKLWFFSFAHPPNIVS